MLGLDLIIVEDGHTIIDEVSLSKMTVTKNNPINVKGKIYITEDDFNNLNNMIKDINDADFE